MIKQFSAKRIFLQGIYDPRINQGMWLALATAVLYLLFYLLGKQHLVIISILAVFPAIVAGADKPGPRFIIRLVQLVLLFSGVTSLVIYLGGYGVPLPVIFFPLIFVCSMFVVCGYAAARVGTSAMFVATIALSWPSNEPAWHFPLLIAVGLIWYGVCAKLWMLYWGHKVLRDILAKLFAAIGDYYALKTDILLKNADEKSRGQFYKYQGAVYTLITQGKAYLDQYDEKYYDQELMILRETFFFAIDVMELLQSSQHNFRKMREFIRNSELQRRFSDMSVAVVEVLKKKSFAIHTRREADLSVDKPLLALEKALDGDRLAESPFVRSLILHIQALRHLLRTQHPVFERQMGTSNGDVGILAKLKPHLNYHSPPFRHALRLATTICCGLFVVDFFDLHKSYWVLLTILLVMQNGYLLTKTMITQRIFGTLGGVVVALLLIQIVGNGLVLLSLSLLVALFTFCMIFFHKTLTILGLTTFVVLFYQLAFGSGEEIVFVRLEDSLIGCGLAFASNILLWPQWNGGGMKRLIKETLHAHEDLLVFCIRSLADESIRFEQLAERRLNLYTAQNNLLTSYQQMLREPQHTREYADSLDQMLSHFMVAAAHTNTLLPMCRGINLMPSDLVNHMEKAVVAMFHQCKETSEQSPNILKEELKIVYSTIEKLQDKEFDSQHFIVIHLLGLIYERLNDIFESLDFCVSLEEYPYHP